MAEAVSHNNGRDIFSAVRKMNAGERSQPVSVDGKADNNDICQMFSDTDDKLYNSMPYDADLFQKIKDKIDQRVLYKMYCKYYISVYIMLLNT